MTATILLLTALPKGQVQLELDKEVREIREALQLSRGHDCFRLEHRSAARWLDVRRAIEALQPQIVHFSGHGVGASGLVFEEEDGKPQYVAADACGRLFELVHAKDIDQETLSQSQSPFNVGTEIELGEFDFDQVEVLARLHGLDGSVARSVMDLVGGHPQLVRLGLYAIAEGQVTLAQLQADGATDAGLYGGHLRRMQGRLEQKEARVKEALRRVLVSPAGVTMTSGRSVTIDLAQKAVLRSLGLVKPDRNQVRITCELYRQYFSTVLGV